MRGSDCQVFIVVVVVCGGGGFGIVVVVVVVPLGLSGGEQPGYNLMHARQ